MTSDFEDRSALCVEAAGRDIALFEHEEVFHAIGNTCTHQGGPLSEGTLDDGEVECPWHGAHFDVTTGEVVGPPAAEDVDSYEVRLRDERIEVKL